MDFFLEDEIKNLITTRNEGERWDFKAEHHANKAEMLHDILCLANGRFEFRNSYLIYGVEDGTGRIVGVESDPNRRPQHDLTQFLLQSHFAGQNRPTVYMHTLELNGHQVDVLEIVNDHRGPYYLEKDYCEGTRKVRKFHIYTRSGGSNTPMDRNADPSQIEELWKKRFGLLLPPALRFNELVQIRNNWSEENGVYYQIYQPEFTVDFKDVTDPTKPLFFAYEAGPESAIYYDLHAKYHNTTLYTLRVIEYDYGRFRAVLPEEGVIPFYQSNLTVRFNYYLLDHVQAALNRLIYKDQGLPSRHKLYTCVPCFESHEQYCAFTNYVAQNEAEFMRQLGTFNQQYRHIVGLHNDTQDIVDRLKHGKILSSMFRDGFKRTAAQP